MYSDNIFNNIKPLQKEKAGLVVNFMEKEN